MPCVEQKRAIIDKLRVNAYGTVERVTVDTIDPFQGKESRIVVIDLVRSYRGRIGFISAQNRANVAISRAKTSSLSSEISAPFVNTLEMPESTGTLIAQVLNLVDR
jgi:hypothetical protein